MVKKHSSGLPYRLALIEEAEELRRPRRLEPEMFTHEAARIAGLETELDMMRTALAEADSDLQACVSRLQSAETEFRNMVAEKDRRIVELQSRLDAIARASTDPVVLPKAAKPGKTVKFRFGGDSAPVVAGPALNARSLQRHADAAYEALSRHMGNAGSELTVGQAIWAHRAMQREEHRLQGRGRGKESHEWVSFIRQTLAELRVAEEDKRPLYMTLRDAGDGNIVIGFIYDPTTEEPRIDRSVSMLGAQTSLRRWTVFFRTPWEEVADQPLVAVDRRPGRAQIDSLAIGAKWPGAIEIHREHASLTIEQVYYNSPISDFDRPRETTRSRSINMQELEGNKLLLCKINRRDV